MKATLCGISLGSGPKTVDLIGASTEGKSQRIRRSRGLLRGIRSARSLTAGQNRLFSSTSAYHSVSLEAARHEVKNFERY